VVAEIVERAGQLPGGSLDRSSDDERLPELLPDAAHRLGLQFDAVVVDEGHEFAETWWIALELLLAEADDGLLAVFADSHRHLYRPGWASPFERPPFELDMNCRNTIEISERVGAVYGEPVPTLGVHGPKPRYVRLKRPADAVGKVQTIVGRLLDDEGFDPGQVTVLAADQQLREQLEDARVMVETVEGFVGLESDVIVLVLGEVETDLDRAIAYSGMSRARALLIVVGPEQARAALNWD
jgi:hypothetical protein